MMMRGAAAPFQLHKRGDRMQFVRHTSFKKAIHVVAEPCFGLIPIDRQSRKYSDCTLSLARILISFFVEVIFICRIVLYHTLESIGFIRPNTQRCNVAKVT